jgi:hypothetical protein
MEKVWNHELEQGLEHNPNKINEAVSNETDRLIGSLENPWVSWEDVWELVNYLSETNPDFKKELVAFQDWNSTKVETMLNANSDNPSKNTESTDNIFDYFWLSWWDFEKINNELREIWLNIQELLIWYKNHIEANLVSLDPLTKEKLKESISKKVLSLLWVINDLKS